MSGLVYRGPLAAIAEAEDLRIEREAEAKRQARADRIEIRAEFMERQEGCCAICGKKETVTESLHLDHEHACCEKGCKWCFRGLLCRECNWGIGNFQDEPERLIAARDYLLRAEKRND